MVVDTSTQRSAAYLGTFNMTPEDMLEVKQIRKMVSNLNKDLKNFGYNYRYYVKLQGRGKDRFNRSKDYYNQKYGRVLSDRYIKAIAARSLPIECSERVDAYIYRR